MNVMTTISPEARAAEMMDLRVDRQAAQARVLEARRRLEAAERELADVDDRLERATAAARRAFGLA